MPMAPAAADDFTFPIFATDPFSSGVDSPSLWHLSPAASPDHSCHAKPEQEQEREQGQEDSDQEEDFQDCFPLYKPAQRKSFSWEEKGSKYGEVDDGDDKEEKMDMLWEDFNEEITSLKRSQSTSRFDSDHDMANRVGCVHQLQSVKLNKTSTAMVSPKKPATAGFVVFIKVLKKLFLLHNSHHHHHHHTRRSVQTHHSRNRRAKNRSW
ncbi:uncharacterized protein LOC8262733 [Ricinus communis]|uniref:Uncharacterized protein n=1 Tax=Ricinus communis TaxID=3988 RepID=B9SLG7_RICCO|nr:uncharacterized protein LOC8262733 [Ricinus communis]EEF35571.1 hypothetical protein RCOM_0686540 [Ricinus communis]|eukprot:XP_002526836.1 uncharacterized protein LOC8262733 [Ricinus communis]